MGQKVNPISLRLQVNKDWQSQWFASKSNFANYLEKDLKARRYIKQQLGFHGAVNRVRIEQRPPDSIIITIQTGRVGVVIGRGGAGIQALTRGLSRIYQIPVKVNIEEIKRAELFAQLVAENIARQLERRISFRRAVKNAASETMRSGAEGVRIEVAGRLGGSDMSRREREVRGSVPLHKLRAMIDYGSARARYPGAGIIGVKVWINKGEAP